VRTPKAGDRGGPGRPRPARGRRDRGAIAELALAGYFAAGAALAIATGPWTGVPVLAVFAAGFGYVGARSLLGR
jgi:hypothetical protein